MEPNATTVSGFCGVNISSLTLVSSSMEIVFIFANVSPNQTTHRKLTKRKGIRHAMFILREQRGYNGIVCLIFTLLKCTKNAFPNFQLGLP